MPAAPSNRSSTPLIGRVAYGMGVAIGRTVDFVTWPVRAFGGKRKRLTRRKIARSPPAVATGFARPAPRTEVDGDFEAAHIAADEGLSALSHALSNPDPAVRTLALGVICELSGDRAARLLASMLHDPDAKVRSAAADSAAQMRASGTVFSLILALDDSSDDVRMTAAQAIESITGERLTFDELGSAERRAKKIDELKHWWKERRFEELMTDTPMRSEP